MAHKAECRAVQAFEANDGEYWRVGARGELPLAEATQRRGRGQVKILRTFEATEPEQQEHRPIGSRGMTTAPADRLMRYPAVSR